MVRFTSYFTQHALSIRTSYRYIKKHIFSKECLYSKKRYRFSCHVLTPASIVKLNLRLYSKISSPYQNGKKLTQLCSHYYSSSASSFKNSIQNENKLCMIQAFVA